MSPRIIILLPMNDDAAPIVDVKPDSIYPKTIIFLIFHMMNISSYEQTLLYFLKMIYSSCQKQNIQ